MADFVFDFGNARGKYFRPKANLFDDFRHAIAFLNESDWRSATARGGIPKGLAKINGQPVAIGDTARRYVIADRPTGAARYKKDYFGIGLAYALSEGFKKDVASVTLIASHAPGDISYAEHLRQAALGIWEIECFHGLLTFKVNEVMTFDEPIGGYSHYTLTETGGERKRNPLKGQTTLVVDVGGWTVDIAAIDDGEIDPLSLRSTRAGIIRLTDDFESYLRSNNRALFQDTGDLDIKRVERALLSGIYKFGNKEVDCHDEAVSVINALVNDIVGVINKAGGAANYDAILLTGGGAVIVHDTLIQAYPRIDFLYAEENTDLMKYANVFGGAKITSLMRAIGVW